MKINLKDVTVTNYCNVTLPMEENKLKELLNPNHDYIITECDNTLPLGEFDNIYEVNKFLSNTNAEFLKSFNDVDEDVLKILTAAGFLYNEIKEMVEEDDFIIIDFTHTTDGWNYGNGGDIHSESDVGLALYSNGYSYLPSEIFVTPEMEDYIDWSAVGRNADCSGWRKCKVNNDYLVKRL